MLVSQSVDMYKPIYMKHIKHLSEKDMYLNQI